MRTRRFHFHALIPEASLKYSLYSSFLLALALSACGGGSSDSPSPNSQPSGTSPQTSSAAAGTGASAQLLANSPQIIGYYGDSTIWGLKSGTTDTQVATPAPAAFAQALAGTARHTVNNKGVNGSTACDLLNGNTGLGINNNWAAEMAGSNATVVIINHAINDSNPGTGESVDQYSACLNGLADTAKARGKKVIFETPNPVDRSGLDVYVSAMKNVAAGKNIPVIDEYTYLSKQLSDTYTIRNMDPDGTHPNDNVYIQKGQYAAGVFKQLPSNF